MFNKFNTKPLWEVSKTLSSVAQGFEPADMVIINSRLINVCTREVIENTDVAVSCGRIALVGDAKHCIGENTEVIDAKGQYIAPGFLDGHIHVESSMLSVSEYARSVVPHGTVGIYMDPHEICNVLGLNGVRYMIEDGKGTPLKNMVTTPSCVPAVPGFEDTGAAVGPEDVRETMKWDEIVGLGEMMNFPGILYSTDHAHGVVGETLKASKTVTGHYSLPETGKGLNGYIASGVRCCHESTRAEDALAKMRLGMYAMFREGSAWHDLKEVSKAITENKVDSRFAVLISDDTHPHTLLKDGHLDHIIKRAIEEGIEPLTAIQMVTINCAQCFQMDHELGSITPGKCADIVFIEDLKDVKITKVIIDGNLVAKGGLLTTSIAKYDYPEDAMNSMHIKNKITPDSFNIMAPNKEKITARVIEIIPERVGTYERHIELKVKDDKVQCDPNKDVLKAVVFERHHETGKAGYGFVKGFGIKRGAMAATVAHDAHNLLVIGTNDEDMALAANTLIECGGGMVAVQDGKVLGLVPLPIAGLMSNKPLEEMAEMVEKLDSAWKEIGCDIVSPFMTMALIPLACLPELRLTNRGLVDCNKFEFVSLFVEE
ncbi:adenine deaminase [Clostridium botulinum]|uniref:Adenine deaminase n=1 Tax=Clostridium botulinum (strain Langeland / NCTC 10281 / Type F) TaxID=441772 RepID=ADEC_CLOBL|nr:adenine deaminase [Clostridium botulinum]A7GA53.2 RecName: Full=Adenine deaminase; Short=Adenase; Short=Adenine aminase [Clostridium botulinum F str. Langeland]KKM41510.1 adenine deaminase [Clostridium botulinum]MBD5645062.1 adenine deaminase [Clostridium botulinum]MBY6792692.1 adenine deaminase [Clostridium botulinum]MBY6938339.1 adenine deaminase [Clostridium botulinum]MBY6945568.1 adenine deaminase [Clostridium botulinum]